MRLTSATNTRTIAPVLATGLQAKKSIMEGAEFTDPDTLKDDLDHQSTVIVTKTTFVTSHAPQASTGDNAATDTSTDTATIANSESHPSTEPLTDSTASEEETATWTAAETAPSSETSPSGDTIFCPFESRPDIYTLCAPPDGQPTDLSAATRAETSSASGSTASRNPLARLRAAVAASSLWWDPIRALADDYATGGRGRATTSLPLRWGSRGRGTAATVAESEYKEKKKGRERHVEANKAGAEVEIAQLKRNLDAARDLIRAQQRLLATQHAMLDEHKKSLAQAVQLLRELKETLRLSRL